MKKLLYILLVGFFWAVSVVVYKGSWYAFFQQDEWSGIGTYYSLTDLNFIEKIIAVYKPMFQAGLGHIVLLTPLANILRYIALGINFKGYVAFSLITHALVCVVLFSLIRTLTKKYLIAIFATLVFVFSVTHSQAVIWVGTAVPTQLAALFSFLSLIFLVNWLEKNSRKDVVLAILSALVAFNFKETSYFLLPLFLISVILFKKGNRKLFIAFFGALPIVYLSFRILIISRNSTLIEAISSVFGLIQFGFSNSIFILSTAIPQLIFPVPMILGMSQVLFFILKATFNNIPTINTYPFDVFLLTFIAKPLMLIISILLFSSVTICIAMAKKQNKMFLTLSLLFLIFSVLPLIFISPQELQNVFLPSRNLYIPLAAFICTVSLLFKNHFKVLILVVGILFVINFPSLRNEINTQIALGATRQAILSQIKTNYPHLPKRVIFYIQSDTSYYTLPEYVKFLPFQSGFGQTLMVWYFPEHSYLAKFLKNRFLWEITDQGYQEIDSYGFGYYREHSMLVEALEKNNLNEESIIAFSWSGVTNVLTDITQDVRKEVSIQR